MKYAIIEISGEQFKAQEGLWIQVPKMNCQKDENLILDKVLFFKDNEEIFLGKPYLENIKVEVTVLDPFFKGKKITVFKYKKATRYRRKYGHRDQYTKLMIQKIIS